MSLATYVTPFVALSLLASVAHAAEPPRVRNAAEGLQSPEAGVWVDAADVPRSAPKPSCGKKPRDGEYVARFKKEANGTFSECVWSYVGPRETYLETFKRCGLSPYDYQYCVSMGPGYNPYVPMPDPRAYSPFRR